MFLGLFPQRAEGRYQVKTKTKAAPSRTTVANVLAAKLSEANSSARLPCKLSSGLRTVLLLLWGFNIFGHI